jgi:hypothetical protein
VHVTELALGHAFQQSASEEHRTEKQINPAASSGVGSEVRVSEASEAAQTACVAISRTGADGSAKAAVAAKDNRTATLQDRLRRDDDMAAGSFPPSEAMRRCMGIPGNTKLSWLSGLRPRGPW